MTGRDVRMLSCYELYVWLRQGCGMGRGMVMRWNGRLRRSEAIMSFGFNAAGLLGVESGWADIAEAGRSFNRAVQVGGASKCSVYFVLLMKCLVLITPISVYD